MSLSDWEVQLNFLAGSDFELYESQRELSAALDANNAWRPLLWGLVIRHHAWLRGPIWIVEGRRALRHGVRLHADIATDAAAATARQNISKLLHGVFDDVIIPLPLTADEDTLRRVRLRDAQAREEMLRKCAALTVNPEGMVIDCTPAKTLTQAVEQYELTISLEEVNRVCEQDLQSVAAQNSTRAGLLKLLPQTKLEEEE